MKDHKMKFDVPETSEEQDVKWLIAHKFSLTDEQFAMFNDRVTGLICGDFSKCNFEADEARMIAYKELF